jgi:ABC-type dipeptide/oligopeptide/nickel transport system ATPase component
MGSPRRLVGRQDRLSCAPAPERLIFLPGYDEAKQVELLINNDIRSVRLAEIALVPQAAMNSLNPVMRIGDQIVDGMRMHRNRKPSEHGEAARLPELMAAVGLLPYVLRVYSHELSGGMKQRVCIAIAISMQPKVIIADEPTSALDVVAQRQIMQTLSTVQRRLGASILLVGL